MRADARQNRERMLAAAEDLFAERGVDTSLDAVAKRAKVGSATLYRRFPSRDALLAAMLDERLLAIARESRSRRGTADPLAALRTFTEAVAGAAIRFNGLAELFGTVLQHPARGCEATTEEGRRLLHDAQVAGRIRQPLSVDDWICVITAVSLAAAGADDPASRIAYLVGLFMDGVIAPLG